jgi:hypothetical protein
MVDFLLALLGAGSISMVVFAIEFYRHLRSAREEYEKARSAVEDIVLSFNRELKREAQRLELVAYRIEEVASKENRALKETEDLQRQVCALRSQPSPQESIIALSTRVEEIEKRFHDSLELQLGLGERITAIEDQARRSALSSEIHVEGIIPIKRDKAIAQLTTTELTALEFIVASGAKTAPEIKEQLKLSREHTARLMKKLYEEGYLERDTSKTPFRYNVKKEMERLLGKMESKAPGNS